MSKKAKYLLFSIGIIAAALVVAVALSMGASKPKDEVTPATIKTDVAQVDSEEETTTNTAKPTKKNNETPPADSEALKDRALITGTITKAGRQGVIGADSPSDPLSPTQSKQVTEGLNTAIAQLMSLPRYGDENPALTAVLNKYFYGYEGNAPTLNSWGGDGRLKLDTSRVVIAGGTQSAGNVKIGFILVNKSTGADEVVCDGYYNLPTNMIKVVNAVPLIDYSKVYRY